MFVEEEERMRLVGIVFEMVLFGMPIGCIIWFIINVINFRKCPKEEIGKKKTIKKLMIASAIISSLFILQYVILFTNILSKFLGI